MKKLFERFFNKEPQLKYIIAEYHPMEANSPNITPRTSNSEGELVAATEMDDMQIDKIYRS